MIKVDTKQFYRYLGTKTLVIKDQPHIQEVDIFWQSSWQEKVIHNEEAT
jgi:hypothetical protein